MTMVGLLQARNRLAMLSVALMIVMVTGPAVALEKLDRSSLRSVSGRAGIDLRFDLRINSNEYGSQDGGSAELVWSDPDGSPSLGISQPGHLGIEGIIFQIETGMDDTTEYITIDAGERSSDGSTEDVIEIAATDNDPNTKDNNINDDDYNDGLYDYSDITFEDTDFEVTDTRIKYFQGGGGGDELGRMTFDGDIGFDGTQLRVWDN